ncbi:hypothetical protein KCU73_g7920, partial [Aureobasidium melanogenum]
MPYTSIIPYNSPLLAANNPITIPMCIHCDEPLLDSRQIVIKCGDSCGYHKSQCVTCLLMEIDDCCIEISFEVAGAVSSLLESKISNDSIPAMKIIDFSIRNYLETALDSRVWLDKYTGHANQVADAVAGNYTCEHLNTTVDEHHSPDLTLNSDAHGLPSAPEVHSKTHVLSSGDRCCTHFDSEGPVLNDDLLDLYLHDPEVPTTNSYTWEDLTVDQLPDYVDEDEVSTPDSEIEIICNDLG